MKRDILTFAEINKVELEQLLESTDELKEALSDGHLEKPFKNKSAVLIFEKPSTRTRVSFEIALWQLGVQPIVLNSTDMQLGRGETIEDTGRVLSRYCDIIIIRTFKHENVEKLASSASVPVINALSDMYHPCQALADLFTIREIKGDLKGRKIAYTGDGNNVCHSLLLAAATAGMDMAVAAPSRYMPDRKVVEKAEEIALTNRCSVLVTDDVSLAVKEADVLYTDVWVSMGDEEEALDRIKVLKDYQINEDVLSMANEDAIVMHCMPAHRGEEITSGVMDGQSSVVFEQAENRLHAQKALLKWILGSD